MIARPLTIRTHLFMLVCAALLPVLIFAGVITAVSWSQQREAFDQRFLNGVRALTIALESELSASIRVLEALALAPEIDTKDVPKTALRARRVLASQPTWSALGMTDGSGKELFRMRGAAGLPAPLNAELIASVISGRKPVVSSLVAEQGAAPFTEIGVPVLRGGAVTGVLIARIDSKTWLDFLMQYPVSPGATVTLNDRNGRIIARTLDYERWVGKTSSSQFLARAHAAEEDAFRGKGVDGNFYYSAFKHSNRGWIVSTGAPVSYVERVLHDSTMAMVVGSLVSIALALGLAFLLGRRIAEPVAALGGAAKALRTARPRRRSACRRSPRSGTSTSRSSSRPRCCASASTRSTRRSHASTQCAPMPKRQTATRTSFWRCWDTSCATR
jgi:hypothetical protein